jgi:hypothetical protein
MTMKNIALTKWHLAINPGDVALTTDVIRAK